MQQKLYCYVDETGQDTKGKFFIVSVIIAQKDRDKVLATLLEIEKQTGKKFTKWQRTSQKKKEAYIHAIFEHIIFKGKIFYSCYKNNISYKELTVLSVASAITTARTTDKYKASIFIDGLQKAEVPAIGSQLRHIGIRTEKIRGLRDENNAIIRLADAIAGFIREYLQKELYTKELFMFGKKNKVVHSLP